jgi:16S rRNA (guanine966-N2)-methyltransferase
VARRKHSPAKNLPGRTPKARRETAASAGVRIIGGQFRGRRLRYSGDPRVRPMKDRVREAVFNLLGPCVQGMHAVDLFAGTGALGLEALSRGAARATLIEQHHPTAEVLRENVAILDAASRADVITANVFLRGRWQHVLGKNPWLVFCSPPYAFYVERAVPLLELLGGLLAAAPPQSAMVVEADQRFDFQRLPDPAAWDVRAYPPAVIGIYVKPPPS